MSPAAVPPVWVPTPPGWVEVAAFDTDERAREHWRDMVEPVRPRLGDRHTEQLYRTLETGRQALRGSRVSSAGFVLTAVGGEAAVWSLSTTVERVAVDRDVNPAALVERAAPASTSTTDDVTFPDGRQGVLVRYRTTVAEAAEAPGALPLPGPGTRLEHCVVAVPLHPRRLVVVSGSSNETQDPDLLAMTAVSMAAGVVVGEDPPTATSALRTVIEGFDRGTTPARADKVRR